MLVCKITDFIAFQKLGLPDTLEKVDGAMRWGYNDKTYLFSGMNKYIKISK